MQPNPQIQQLLSLGFIDQLPPPPQRSIIKIAGPEKSGKSHLACTGPGPIIYFSIDKGTEGVVEKFQQSGKQILVYETRYEDGKDIVTYQAIWTAFRQRLDVALLLNTGTIVIDTFSEIYELARYAHFGRLKQVMPGEYSQVYPDLRRIVDDVYATSMSACFLTKMMKGFGSKELEERGFNEMDFRVQTNIRVFRQDITDQATGRVDHVFNAWVKDSRQNMGLTGMTFSSHNPDGVDRFNLETIVYLIHNWDVRAAQNGTGG